MSAVNRTVNVYLDKTATLLWDNYDCTPVECCVFDYRVLNDTKLPWSWADDTEVQILEPDLAKGEDVNKKTLQIKNNIILGEKIFYIYAYVSSRSVNYVASNFIETNSAELIPITVVVACEPLKTEIFEGNYNGTEERFQLVSEGE